MLILMHGIYSTQGLAKLILHFRKGNYFLTHFLHTVCIAATSVLQAWEPVVCAQDHSCSKSDLKAFLTSPTMVVRLRLSMHGPTNNKFFHIVAMNARQARDAKPIETLGIYKPTVLRDDGRTAKTVEWSAQRIKYWLGVGAIPSKSAVKLFTQVCICWPRFVGCCTDIGLQGRILPPDSQYHPKPRSTSTPPSSNSAALPKVRV